MNEGWGRTPDGDGAVTASHPQRRPSTSYHLHSGVVHPGRRFQINPTTWATSSAHDIEALGQDAVRRSR